MRNASPQVEVCVPATTANLGPGFDILGLALQLYNRFSLVVTSEPGWRVDLPPDVDLPSNDNNLVLQAIRHLFSHVGFTCTGMHLTQVIDIPLARGLGSSSTAIVGGLIAANYLSGADLNRETLLAMAIELEGHPDNVTPALMGGLTLSYMANGRHHYLSLSFPEELSAIIAIPEFELSTADARSVLPKQISREDAIFNSSRTALLVYALQQQRFDLLKTAMDDRLHQPYRAALVPGMADAIRAAYQAKALGVALSGAGPSLLAFARDHTDAIATAMQHTFSQHGICCQTRILSADTHGATIVTPRP
ncbi:MAG: homoserine kinase [bacterium]|nr:homoserine kinase [bacterium]